MKNFIFPFALMLISGITLAQTVRIENWPNGTKRTEGAYKYDVQLSANASKQDIQKVADKMIKVGEWQSWFENGQIQAVENYTSDGVLTGIQKTFYLNGKPASLINFDSKTALYWHDNGQKQSEGAILHDGRSTGIWIGWYANGVKNYEGSYDKNGQKDGAWKFWDENGKSMGVQNFKNGTLIN